MAGELSDGEVDRPGGQPLTFQGEQQRKAYEDKTLAEVLAAPVSALAGVTDSDAKHLEAAFNIKTVADLGKNKYFAAAQAMLRLTT